MNSSEFTFVGPAVALAEVGTAVEDAVEDSLTDELDGFLAECSEALRLLDVLYFDDGGSFDAVVDSLANLDAFLAECGGAVR